MEEIRAFIAIELTPEVKECLRNIQLALRDNSRYVKWVDPDGIHLTLSFLGNVSSDVVLKLHDVIEFAAQNIPPFKLELSETGIFPNLKRVQVAWVGLSGEIDVLQKLHKLIETKVVPLGFKPENRPFKAHLTLARIRDNASPQQREAFAKLLLSQKIEKDCSFEVQGVSLMRSQLTPQGAVYTRLFAAELTDSLNKSKL